MRSVMLIGSTVSMIVQRSAHVPDVRCCPSLAAWLGRNCDRQRRCHGCEPASLYAAAKLHVEVADSRVGGALALPSCSVTAFLAASASLDASSVAFTST
jgi:hypothetical protein